MNAPPRNLLRMTVLKILIAPEVRSAVLRTAVYSSVRLPSLVEEGSR